MISTRFVKLAVSGIVLGMSLTGGHAVNNTESSSSTEAKQLQMAATAAVQAKSWLAASNFRAAVRSAETAVEYAPRDASYRMLLGQAYLGAGRFTSAEASFTDALTLAPDTGRGGLNLALTQIAQGKRDAAMATLADYRDKIAASDYGLAVALAGDVDTAAMTLESAIRAGGSDAKTRQNLALVYAMAGKWSEARIMASQDLSSADVDLRIGQWSTFVRPSSSYDQVASMLGVRAVQDAGSAVAAGAQCRCGANCGCGSRTDNPPKPSAHQSRSLKSQSLRACCGCRYTAARLSKRLQRLFVRRRLSFVLTSNAIKQVVVPCLAADAPVKTVAMLFKPARSVTARESSSCSLVRSRMLPFRAIRGGGCRRAMACRRSIRQTALHAFVARRSSVCRLAVSKPAAMPTWSVRVSATPVAIALFAALSAMHRPYGRSAACQRAPSPSGWQRAN